ncbi:MAG: sialate O-acetylesterase [Acidobacteriota bacterium]
MIQRGADGLASIALTSRVGWLARTVEVATADADYRSVNRWQALTSPKWTQFHGTLHFPTGCQPLWLRVGEPRPPGAFNHVEVGEVCVGEVFIIAGQSNAAGSCATLFSAASPLVRTGLVDENGRLTWRFGHDPQVLNGGGSVWPLVGDLLAQRLEAPIGFINVAVGGSSIRDWAPGTPYFRRLVEVLQTLEPTGVRAVLWHQGESDSAMAAEEYATRLTEIIKATRSAIQGTLPVWIIAQTSFKDGQQRWPNLCRRPRRSTSRLGKRSGAAWTGHRPAWTRHAPAGPSPLQHDRHTGSRPALG